MKMTPRPRSRAWRMYLSTTPDCFTPSAAVGRVEPEKHSNRGCFARPVGAGHAGHLAPADLQVDALQREDAAVVLAGVGEPDQWRGMAGRPGLRGRRRHRITSARLRTRLLSRIAPSSRAPRKK